jgi:hypothetical protein
MDNVQKHKSCNKKALEHEQWSQTTHSVALNMSTFLLVLVINSKFISFI